MKGQPDAEAFRERGLFLAGLARMQFAPDDPAALVVLHGFGHEVAAVGGGVNQDVFRRVGQRAIEDDLDGLVVRVIGGKGQIIAIQDKAPVLAIQRLDDRLQFGQFIARDLDQVQPLAFIFSQQRLDQGRLARAFRPPEQRVIGRQAGQELCRVADDTALLPLDAV